VVEAAHVAMFVASKRRLEHFEVDTGPSRERNLMRGERISGGFYASPASRSGQVWGERRLKDKKAAAAHLPCNASPWRDRFCGRVQSDMEAWRAVTQGRAHA
jgi:hypothetical protein